jgi:hypothetical protein
MDELHSEFDRANPLGNSPSVLRTGISALGTRISFTVPDELPPNAKSASQRADPASLILNPIQVRYQTALRPGYARWAVL